MNAKEAIELGKKHGAVMVDLKFIDLPGKWQHTSVPFERLEAESFDEGFGFDGSSIRGFQPINQSDMLLIPDPETAVMDPFTKHPTLSLQCTIQDTITRQNYSRDPRHIARKAEAYLKSTGIADTAYFGPEAEFFIFDDVRFDAGSSSAYYHIDSIEADWNTGRDEKPNLGHKIRHKEGYFPVPPQDSQMDLRTEICLEMKRVGIEVEVSHHEVATAGQGEIDMRYDSMVRCADKLMWFKHIVKNVAHRYNKTATFMPKPIYGDNGNGMHCHQSLWTDGKPLFAGDGYAGLSDIALWYIGGILKHARALTAITNPTTNSYRRLGAGLRSSGESGLLEPEPLGGDSHLDVLAVTQGAAAGAAFPRPDVQSLHCVLSHAARRSGRHPEQDRPGGSAGQGHLLALAGGAEGRGPGSGLARGRPQRLGAGSRVLAQRRCVHPGRHRDVARLQARAGAAVHPAASHAGGVLPVLRHLTAEGPGDGRAAAGR